MRTNDSSLPLSKGSGHGKTLRIKRLLATQLKLFRLEVIGQDHPVLARAGSLLVFGPVLLVGYAFALAALVRLVAIRIGWSVSLLVVGVAHLVVATWGMRRGRALAFVQSYQVGIPECEAEEPPTQRFKFDSAATRPNIHPLASLKEPASDVESPHPAV
jgi:hypothetical protein